MGFMEELLIDVVNAGILLFEYTGVIIILIACIKGIWNYVLKKPKTRLDLAKGLALGLEFKIGSEILRTVIVREWQEIVIVASIIILRALITFLIHWEIKNEENAAMELEKQA